MKVFAAVTVNQSSATLPELLVNVLNYILPALSAIVVGAIIYAGVLYLISQGEPDRLTKAKNALLWAVVGTIIIVLSLGLVLGLKSIINNQIIN